MVISMKQKIKYSIFLLLLLVLMDILLYQNAIKKSIVSKRNQVTNLLSGNRKVTFMKKIF